jgi:hypothetical protein
LAEVDYNKKRTDEIKTDEIMLEDNDRRSDPIYLIDHQDLAKCNDTIEEYFILYSSLNDGSLRN